MCKKLLFDERFITGLREVDEQHRNLVSLTNEASEVLAESPASTVVMEIVHELLSYAIYHFDTEERLMQEHGYVEGDRETADEHVRMHREFSARVVAIQGMLDRGEFVDTAGLIGFLHEWITHHILETDQQFAAFVLAQGAAPAEV